MLGVKGGSTAIADMVCDCLRRKSRDVRSHNLSNHPNPIFSQIQQENNQLRSRTATSTQNPAIQHLFISPLDPLIARLAIYSR